MEENSSKKALKKNELLEKEEDKRSTIFSKYKGDITQKEYNLRIRNSFFFMRSPLSNKMIYEARPESRKKRKKKKRQRTYFHTQFKHEIKNNNLKPFQKKQSRNSYVNLQPRKTWLNCEKIYNKCLKRYIPETTTFEKKFNKELSQENIINKNNIANSDKGMKYLKGKDRRANYLLKPIGRKSLKNVRLVNYNLILFKNNLLAKNENNFVKCMKAINTNFTNEGINNILEKINSKENIESLKDFKLGKNKEKKKSKKSLKISLSFKFERKRPSLLNMDLSQIEIAKKMGIDFGFKYKINSFFEYGTNIPNFINNENDDELEIVPEKGNLTLKKLNLRDDNIENANEDQKFNFFCLKNIFRLEEFYIFGLIFGKGKEPTKCSRLLKKILINKLSNEKNYIFNEILEKNKFSKKIDYISYILTFNEFEFLKNIFNTLEEEMNNMGVEIEDTGATLSLIIFIKDKVISAKIGDINPYFVYNIIDDKYDNNLMIRNPHSEHNINNILEKYRLEENKCDIKINKNNIGRNSYLILNNDNEIQNYLNTYNIKCTRMLGFRKLKKIGIINEPEIHTFSMVLNKEYIQIFPTKRKNKNINPHISDNDFIELIKKNGINFSQVILKFVVLGNDKLFQVMKKSYYIKEINEAMKKDEIENRQKDNIKYCFNLQKTLKKLINDGVELNKKLFNTNNFKDLSLSLVTLVEN